MTPLECCQIGATYGATGSRDLTALQAAARAHAHFPFAIEVLEKELRRHPEAVDGWVRWSEDKRWSPAWYLSVEERRCLVGYFSANRSECQSSDFKDRFHACAAFILHELEDYRTLLEAKGEW